MRVTVVLAILVMALAASVPAQEWPEWRGPKRDGTVSGITLPDPWPPALDRKWRVVVGEGHSSPVLSGGRIYQFGRLEDKETVTAIDQESGEVLWRNSYAAPYRMSSAAIKHGKGPKSTPVIHAGRLCTLGISGILSCFDASSGKRVWWKEFSKRFSRTSPIYGAAMSPMVYGDLLIAHVGGHGGGALAAFDLASGEEKWAWAGDGPGYASPVLVKLDGTLQLVTQTENKIIGVAPDSGELLWEMPLKTPYYQNIVTPMIHDGVLILSALQNPTMAVRVTSEAGRWKTEKLWENSEAYMYMSSPVLGDGLIFGFTRRNSGQYFCQDPKTGKVLWRGRPRSGDNAAILRSGNTLLMLSDEAELTVARVSGERLDKIAGYTVADSPTWAHPALTKDGILVKDLDSLAFWAW